MMTDRRRVTERDFRKPEFADADPDDYEFRSDGMIVRKDRWMTGMQSIANAVGLNSRNGFEIPDVVQAVRRLAMMNCTADWLPIEGLRELDNDVVECESSVRIHVRLKDGSILMNADYHMKPVGVCWRESMFAMEELSGWRRA